MRFFHRPGDRITSKFLNVTTLCYMISTLITVACLIGIASYSATKATSLENKLQTANKELLYLQELYQEYQSSTFIEFAKVSGELDQAEHHIDVLEGKVEIIDESINGRDKRKARIKKAIAIIKDTLPEYGNPLPGCPKAPSPGELWSIAGAIVDNADEYAVPAPLIAAVIRQESAFCNLALSSAGAKGYMQLMPETAAEVASDVAIKNGRTLRTWRGRDNIQMGTAYLSQMILEFDGRVEYAVQAYNAGPIHVKRVLAGERVLYEETQGYVRNVLIFKAEYERLGLL